MTSNEKFTGLEKIDLASAEVHAPVEVTFSVYIQLPDGRMGSMRAAMPPGQIPSRAAMRLVLDSFTDADGKIPGAPVGARLSTRGEFVSHLVKRETGEAFALDAGAQYSPIPSDPSDLSDEILVNAIIGFGLPEQYQDKFAEEGLAFGASWRKDKLIDLPSGALLSVYDWITA